MKTFESYQPEPPIDWEDKHLEVLKEIETVITSEVEGFLQGWGKNPMNNPLYPITSLREAWMAFVIKSRVGWEEKLEPFLKNSVYWREIRGGNNPLRIVGEVTHTMDLLGKSYLDVKGRPSYEVILNKYVNEKPTMAGDVYVPGYFSPESKRGIESIATVGNMGLF